MPLIEVTSEEQHEIALGLKLLRIRQERLGYGDPVATRELTDRIRAGRTSDAHPSTWGCYSLSFN